MPWIKQIPLAEATGPLKAQFDAALKRAGRVWHIVHIMSLNPKAMRDSIALYITIMMGESPLTRVQREMLATVVSAELHCYYALCEFAAKLTHHQHDMAPADLDALRAHGLDDRALHDAVQVIAYFNYITRVADALGVEPEDFITPWGR